jgi:F-type H+-transporting ATPase subunit b
MSRFLTSRNTQKLGLAALSIFVLLLAMTAAQDQKSQPTNPEPAKTDQPQKKSAGQSAEPKNKGFGATLAEESKEAEGDDTAEFKNAPAIHFLSRITGLSLHGTWWLALLLNFVVIAALIFWASKKFLPGVFRQRTASIQKAMEDARKASADANRRLSEIEARLSRLDTEISTMRASADQEAAAEEARIQAAAQEDARKIVESAEQEIVAAGKQVRRELTVYAADLAVSLAKKQIHVDASTDQQLVRGFADQLSNGGKGGR